MGSLDTYPLSSDCAIPPMNSASSRLTLSFLSKSSRLVSCGGNNSTQSCVSYEQGTSWQTFATMAKNRTGHSDWVFIDNEGEEKILLMGGEQSSKSTEVAQGQFGTDFHLSFNGAGSCAICLRSIVVLTGGFRRTHRLRAGGHKKVVSYTFTGARAMLPSLRTPRFYHACSWFITGGAVVYLVTGGTSDGQIFLKSTEILLPSATTWDFAKPLPHPLAGAAVALMEEERPILTGGDLGGGEFSDKVLEYRYERDEWKEVGKMLVPRAYHGIAVVPYNSDVCKV